MAPRHRMFINTPGTARRTKPSKEGMVRLAGYKTSHWSWERNCFVGPTENWEDRESKARGAQRQSRNESMEPEQI